MNFIKILAYKIIFISSAFATIDDGIRNFQQGNIAIAEKIFSNLAEQGNAEALFYASQIKLFSDPPDVQKGLELLRKSAGQSFPYALDALGGFYLHGQFVEKDHHRALIYYKLAADRGYGPSQFNYGIMLKNGEKTPRDLETAFIYLSLAALNHDDLDDITEDAALYRNEVAQQLSSEAYQRAMLKINKIIRKK